MTIDDIRKETVKPALVADENGLIVFVNGVFEKSFGWTIKDLLGQPLTVIMPPAFRTQHHLGFSRFLTTGQSTIMGKSLNLKVLTKDGREIDSEHFIIAGKEKGRWVFGATITA